MYVLNQKVLGPFFIVFLAEKEKKALKYGHCTVLYYTLQFFHFKAYIFAHKIIILLLYCTVLYFAVLYINIINLLIIGMSFLSS